MSEGRRFALGSFRGRQVAVVGMGKSNQALTRYLAREGARVTCFDRKTAEEMGLAHRELSRMGVHWSLGVGYLNELPRFKWVFLTPGMKKNQQEIIEVRGNGAVISSEIGLFLDRCRCPVAAVTGSAGKTTSCTLAGLMLKESLPTTAVHVGGNIGSVLIEQVDNIPEDAVVVLELSSFQLEMVTRSPHIAVVLNIRPNHLDVHDSYEDYVSAKKNIYRFQGKKDWCLLNLDDSATRGLTDECPGNTGFFSMDPPAIRPSPLAWADNTSLYVDPGQMRMSEGVAAAWGGEGFRKVAERSDLLIPGEHNISNALAAALLSTAMGATPEGIGRAVRGFRGVEHRIEFVRELRGVRYLNDSIATSPDRTEALLDAVEGPLVLILGGYDKGLPFDLMAQKVVRRGCSVITIGKTAPIIEEALRAASKTSGESLTPLPYVARAASLDEAVIMATEKARSMSGSSVALSPACASYDMFRSFEERGRLFKEAVRRLE